jgi:DNA-binding PadR family transcriptional regulator
MHRHHHHFHDHHEMRGRYGWGGVGRMGHRGRHREGRIGRFLDHGDLRFVVLALIAEQRAHGYELIKALEERTGGAYRPSPGVIYPLLAMLEDEGFIRPVDAAAGRKAYQITEEGKVALEQNRAGVDEVFGRMDEASRGSRMAGPRISRAMTNLGMALGARMRRGDITDAQIDRIIAMIDDTAAAIEKV